MIISLDTETTGIDLAHGAMPFLVTSTEVGCDPIFWEWDVDPRTRRPDIPSGDVADIAELVEAAELIYLHNAKFDSRALAKIGVDLPWSKVRDSLVMSHLLASNHSHKLDKLCIEYLGSDIEPLEVAVKEVVQACRAVVKRDYPTWRIADEGLPDMPSVKSSSKRDEDKPWKNDMWLPRALERDHPNNALPSKWTTACSQYANADSEHTLYLGLELERLIRERGYWAIYEHRLNLPRVACDMECWGVTAIGEYTEATIRAYCEHIAEVEDALVTIAAGYGHRLELADGSSINDNMRDFFYGAVWQSCPRCTYTKRVKHWMGETGDGEVCPKCLKTTKRRVGMSHKLVTSSRRNLGLPVISTRSVAASLDKDSMTEYLATTDGDAHDFLRLLIDKRKRGTDLTYMEAYRRFWRPVPGSLGYYRIHPSLNPCATDHLRWASNSPNLQNVSVQEEECEECDGAGCGSCGGTGKSRLSVRRCFGPAPDREWWDMDFKNLEKRIPAYEAQEPALIEVFEKPDEPPYWGSDHNLLASLLFPDEFWPIADIEGEFKRRFLSKYKRVKNTNFAKQYGAGKRKVDATAGVVGAYERIERGLPELAKSQAHYLALAEKTGFVETLPDRTVDPTRGYPILASRTEDGRVLSTTPFNYHVSGTACWCKNTALVRCADQCARWRAEGFDAHVALEVHDSILFDFPRGATMEENLPRAVVLRKLMEQSGDDLIPAIPTPVSVEYHTESWAEGKKV
jgi:DNA polymerase I-like protein with 3'-5' exonuclease and polymerase domains